MIAVIDYNMGNVRSVEKGFQRIGMDAIVTRDPGVIRDATHVVLPGVGAFRDCMDNLERFGLIDVIRDGIESGKPFLGICLGLQVLFEESHEFGIHRGLSIIKGKVVRFPSDMEVDGERLKVPHMGWNQINIKKPSPLLTGIDDGTYFYFVHSYYCVPDEDEVVITTSSYGVEFVSTISRDNIFACQFHPEKSQKVGLRLLKNFAGMR